MKYAIEAVNKEISDKVITQFGGTDNHITINTKPQCRKEKGDE